jgi:hypothetical protein
MITGTWDRFWAVGALWLAIIVMLEYVRMLRLNRLPWWIVHGPVIAWGAVALVPWFIALRGGIWMVPVPLATVPLSLPATYGYSLLALIGLAVAIIPFALVGQRASYGERPLTRARIVPRRAFIAIALLSVIYVGSLPSISRIWVLSGTSGEDLYSNTTSTSSSFLGLSLVVLAGVAIGYLARQQPLSRVGLSMYLILLIVAFGSAHRDLVMILILAYLILRNPIRAIRRSFLQILTFLLIGVAAVWLVGFGGLGQLSVLRSGVPASNPSVYTERTLSSLDVMGSAEYLLESGVRPGQLHGSSYTAIPTELIPHALLGTRSGPPAIQVVEGAFGAKTGASAPLWIEGVLNFGAVGDVLSMVFVGGLWGLLLRKAVSSHSRLGRAVTMIGPVWMLFAYQALSRILMLAAIDIFASIIIGILIWNWMQVEESVMSSSLAVPDSQPLLQGQSAALELSPSDGRRPGKF